MERAAVSGGLFLYFFILVFFYFSSGMDEVGFCLCPSEGLKKKSISECRVGVQTHTRVCFRVEFLILLFY